MNSEAFWCRNGLTADLALQYTNTEQARRIFLFAGLNFAFNLGFRFSHIYFCFSIYTDAIFSSSARYSGLGFFTNPSLL